MKNLINILSTSLIFFCSLAASNQQVSVSSKDQNAQEFFCQLVYLDNRTRDHLIALTQLLPDFPWSESYKKICADINDHATVMMYKDVTIILAESLVAAEKLSEYPQIKQQLERYQQLLHEEKAHICTWEQDEESQLHTRNFDDDRIILQLGVRSLTVEGTEVVDGLLLVNGILKVNGRIILNNVDLSTLIANSGCSSGGGCITTIDGNSGSVTGTTVTIAGGNNIFTTGSGASLIVSVTGTTTNAVQIGNALGSLTSVITGTAGQVLTSNGPSAAPTFQTPTNGVTTIHGDTSFVSGNTLTFNANTLGGTPTFNGDGSQTMTLNFTGGAENTCLGQGTPQTPGNLGNTAIGYQALSASNGTGGLSNTAIGVNALAALNTDDDNTAVGYNAGAHITSGLRNTIVGSGAGSSLTALPSDNTFIGFNAGSSYTGGESSNICIGAGVTGSVGESNTLRLGLPYDGTNGINFTFINGLLALTGSTSSVLVDINNKVGTIQSSKRFKENILPMQHNLSDKILDLQPVSFNYKTDKEKTTIHGLIAEEVAEIFPQLVMYDKNNKPFTVKYHELPTLLLNLLKRLTDKFSTVSAQAELLTQKLEHIKKPSHTTKPSAQELFCQLVYLDNRTREHLLTLRELLSDIAWPTTYQKICADLLDGATVMQDNDVTAAIEQSLIAIAHHKEHAHIKQKLEQYQQLLHEGKAHICNWHITENNQLHTRNFDDSRIILQLGVRSLTVEGTEIVNGLLLVNGIVKVNGRIILNNTDITDLIISSSCSGSSGCISIITGNSGSVSNTTVSIIGGSDIQTTGSGTSLIVSVTGTTNNAVQIGNISNNGSLSSIVTGTAGYVLTSNGPGVAPTFQAPSSVVTFNGDTGSPISTNPFLFTAAALGGTTKFVGNGTTTMQLNFTDSNKNTCIGTSAANGSHLTASTCVGYQALNGLNNSAFTGSQNTILGYNSLKSLGAISAFSNANNTAIGAGAGLNVPGGANSTYIGSLAGSTSISTARDNNTHIGFATSENNLSGSDCIYIGFGAGPATSESNTMRIGNSDNSATFIAGINGASVQPNPNNIQVLIVTGTNQLGVLSSSREFKENIVPLSNLLNNKVLTLQPTVFNYKADAHKTPTWGLIAEEIQTVIPELVVYDPQNMPLSVKYHELPVLLLNILKKLHTDIALSEHAIATLTKKIEFIEKI